MDVDDLDEITVLGEHLINSVMQKEPLDAIKSIIENGAPIWYQNEDEGLSALHAAAYIQDEMLTKYFIEAGAVWNAGRYVLNPYI
jgi:type IV protein arginine methyltransferase